MTLGCAGETRAPARDTAAAVTNVPVVAESGCDKVGLWTRCNVEDRLVRAGLVIELVDSTLRSDLFSVQGLRYQVGGGDDRLDLFVYPTADARLHDTRELDSANVSPKGKRRAYAVPPLLVTSNNLVGVVSTLNERSRERMALALSAGLPPR